MHRLIFIFALPLLADAPTTWDLHNAFAADHRIWAQMRNARADNPDVLSAAEVIQWQKVKSEWRKLEKQVDAEYRGERR